MEIQLSIYNTEDKKEEMINHKEIKFEEKELSDKKLQKFV